MKVVKSLINYSIEEGYASFVTNCVEIRVYYLTDDIIRIRAGFDGDFVEASYSLVLTGWDDAMDEMLGSERKRISLASFTVDENESCITLIGQSLDTCITKEPFTIKIADKHGSVLHEDIPDLAYQLDSNSRRIHTSSINSDDCFYGFGEKTGDINKAEKFMNMAPNDAMGYNPKERDSLYKHIPFYIKLSASSKKAMGYFYHTSSECDFNMGRKHSNYWHKHSTFRADAGDIDVFIINGPKISDVISRYTDLTGKSCLLPKQALGYLGSSMYYAELEKDCDDAILHFADNAAAEDIPMDGFMLSSGYTTQHTQKGDKRCVFTWNYDRFKDPTDFFKQMSDKGIVVSPNVKPGILTCHPDYYDFADDDMFILDSEEDTPAIGTWWGGPGSFIDYTNAEVRDKWKKRLDEAILSKGVTSVWNDNCEYDSMVDKDARVCLEGLGGTIGNSKAYMSNIMCKITNEAINERFENVRPFVVCRSGHSGIQRYAQVWAGDNLTCWDALKYNIATILGMGLSGVANEGCDIGGFYGPSPDMELFVRWVQNGIFQPRFSIHSVNTDNTVTEPWMYPAVTPIIREAIKLRYQFMPYMYSLMRRASISGLPILESMAYAFQEDPDCYNEGVDFMFGDSILVANVVDEGAVTRELYLPKNHTFFDYYTHEPIEGGQTIEFDVSLSDIPMFYKDGAIVVTTDDELKSLAKDHESSLTVTITPAGNNAGNNTDNIDIGSVIKSNAATASFTLYEDDGISLDYQKGMYLTTDIEVCYDRDITISFTKQGQYKSSVKDMSICYISPDRSPLSVSLDDKKLTQYTYYKDYENNDSCWIYDFDTRSVLIKYPNIEGDYKVELSYEAFDMLGM